MALLEVRDLAVEYATERGPLRAVDGVSFDLDEGHALGVIGESGSGKTSVAIALMRLLPRNARQVGGSVRLRGEEIGAFSEDDFRRRVRWSGMAMVFQGAMHALNPVVRVGDQVGERLRADGSAAAAVRSRVADLLARVGLPATAASRYPHELSGGMKQRVMIASALTHDPPLLILDEPTSALDVSVQAQIMNLLKELKAERGMAMLFITHDLALASDLCDRLAVVYAGQIRELGRAEAVLGSPQDPYTQALLASIPSLYAERAPAFLRGAPPDMRVTPPGCRFQQRCALAFEPCDKLPPPLVEPRPGQWARCWLHDGSWRDRLAPAGGPATEGGTGEPATTGTRAAS